MSLRLNLISRSVAVALHKISRGAMDRTRVVALQPPRVFLAKQMSLFQPRLAFVLIGVMLLSTLSPSVQAAQTQEVECQVGTSASCPALSAQEIYNLYGTTTDGTYYLKISGSATQVYLKMDRTNTANGGWILMMKAPRTSTSFYYDSTYFTSNTTSTGSALTNDTTSDGKSSAYNSVPLTGAIVAFSNPAVGSVTNDGDIASNGFGAWVWYETFTAQTMYARLTTTQNIYSTYATVRNSLYRNSSNTAVFSYQTGYGVYGFNHSTACNTHLFRWGIIWNNEAAEDGSCDDHIGIGLQNGVIQGDQPNWNGVTAASGQNTSNGYNGGLGPMAFQLWGKQADPAFGTPQTLTSTPSATQVNLSWAAPASGTVNEYVVQYKKNSTANWSGASTVRITSPTASPTASISGLDQGTLYNFRVWARSTSDSSATPLTGNATTGVATISQVTLNTANPVYRSPSILSANVNAVGRATFFAQGKPIPGCKNILTTISLATCTWAPSQRTYVNIMVTYAPVSLPNQSSSSSMTIWVQGRAIGSKKR